MARRPNYGFEKAERERKKAEKRAAKKEKRQKKDQVPEPAGAQVEQTHEGTTNEAFRGTD